LTWTSTKECDRVPTCSRCPEIATIERVVGETDTYKLVEKIVGADYAVKTDPRTRDETNISRRTRRTFGTPTSVAMQPTVLGEVVSRAELDGNIIPFLCECADEFCLGRIELSLSQYQDAQVLPTRT
jgi:hypothetical protein